MAVVLLAIIGHGGGKLRIQELEGRVAEMTQEAEALREKQPFLSGGTAKDSNRSWITDELWERREQPEEGFANRPRADRLETSADRLER